MDDAAIADNVLLFGRVLRRAGMAVHHTRLLDALRALQWIDIGRRDDVHAILKALLVHRHDDLATFDAAFSLFFRAHTRPESSAPSPPALDVRHRVETASATFAMSLAADDVGAMKDERGERAVSAYSASAVPRVKDFADFSASELEAARHVLTHIPWRLGTRRTRRWERAAGTSIDLRPLLRRALTRGEIIELSYRRRRTTPRPIVFIGDVSGSMERYSRILMHFVYGLARHARVESFVFATTLTRITRRVARRGTERALSQVVREVTDWGGGTRIGESLRVFNVRWARRVMRHGPIVLLVSDGWDRGRPDILTRELARVKRSCHRLIWLNPLLGSPSYEPLTRGMQAALPLVDDFLPAHNLVSLEQLAQRLSE